MKDKLKAVFDSKVTWVTIGTFVGTLLGDKAAAIVQGVGSVVMAIL